MNVGLHLIDKLRDALNRHLEEKKLRKTSERYAILECICNIGGHFDAEMLRLLLEGKHFRVSRACIYNTLDLLMEAGIIVRHLFTSQIVQYELTNAATTHHHLICSYCGTIKDIKSEKIKILSDYRIPKFTPEHQFLYIYGMCSKCKFRLMKERKTKNKPVI